MTAAADAFKGLKGNRNDCGITPLEWN
ncbi:MAG: hypothetical protein RIS14_899, partial [Pseudomonadota bacterium]